LSTRDAGKPAPGFCASRALRLLPSYWFVSVATYVIAWQLAGNFSPLLNPLPVWRNLNLFALPASIIGYVVVSLGTLIGSDTWLWLGFSSTNGHLSVAPAYAPAATSVLVLTAVPQAWTIGIEILFYLLPPFIARRSL